MQRSIIRIHNEDGTTETIKRTLYFDGVTTAWYIVIDRNKFYAYPECDNTADCYMTPYSREHYQRYGLIERANVKIDGVVNKQAVQFERTNLNNTTLLDGTPVTYDRNERCYVIVSSEPTTSEPTTSEPTTSEPTTSEVSDESMLNTLKNQIRAITSALDATHTKKFHDCIEARQLKHAVCTLIGELQFHGVLDESLYIVNGSIIKPF